MNQMAFMHFLMNASDKEIQKIVLKRAGVNLSLQDIQQLRPLLAEANISWLLSGIPKEILKKVDRVIGKDKRKKLMELLN
ncbi:hypothetical protein [Bacillus ndiopicus]|uniref:hypothetical protein n=1 Tax=Bacillus ndiopicus TaxID=1347368 RepID=UPI0005A854C6|nr:hypothetical protein [Bacillus ndiopicus]